MDYDLAQLIEEVARPMVSARTDTGKALVALVRHCVLWADRHSLCEAMVLIQPGGMDALMELGVTLVQAVREGMLIQSEEENT